MPPKENKSRGKVTRKKLIEKSAAENKEEVKRVKLASTDGKTLAPTDGKKLVSTDSKTGKNKVMHKNSTTEAEEEAHAKATKQKSNTRGTGTKKAKQAANGDIGNIIHLLYWGVFYY